MRKFLQRLSKLNKKIQPYTTHIVKEWIWTFKYLKFKNKPLDDTPIGLMRVDGRGYHGGMTDRFKGAVSWWHYCKKNDLKFKLLYNYPFHLTEYVVPNEYDWTIDEKDIPDGIRQTRIFYGRGENGKRLEKFKTRKNVWYYGNIDLGNTLKYSPYTDDWGAAFRMLFKPSPLLENHLEIYRSEIGCKYLAVVFRFQNLLGDFNEPHYRRINNNRERDRLIAAALAELDRIHSQNEGKKVLVTSDSINFLNEVAKKEYVYVIKGNITHMEFTDNDISHAQLKSFMDFYMIAGAEKVYSVVIGDMYMSDFPVYAAKVGGVPFERVILPPVV